MSRLSWWLRCLRCGGSGVVLAVAGLWQWGCGVVTGAWPESGRDMVGKKGSRRLGWQRLLPWWWRGSGVVVEMTAAMVMMVPAM
nr:hypothetical protein [Tanacetum cinerariifolium]